MNRRAAILAALGALPLRAEKPRRLNGAELAGTAAPRLELKHWMNSRPLEITDLRGKAVLLRWWTRECPFCVATAPALRKLQRDYGARGLQVIGIYHPKPPGDWDVARFESATREKQFTFPVALDANWTALKRWWLDRERDWTSVSFLVDRQGIIRYVHPGGEFHEGTQGGLDNHDSCQRDLRTIETKIAQLLAT
jgi:peroxiredoxin